MIVGIDASRNRSGGAKAHLTGILTGSNPQEYGIDKVHLWAYKSLADSVPDLPWLTKHTPSALGKNLLHQVWWQYNKLPREAEHFGCKLMFNTDAGSVCPFQPSVTLSQDMLSYEPGEMQRFGYTKDRLRLLMLKFVQSRSLKRSRGAIFLTQYASDVIQQNTGQLLCKKIIPHGIDDAFRQITNRINCPANEKGSLSFLYVSNTSWYKHQWNVVKAIGKVRNSGIDAKLCLIGGGKGPAQELLDQVINDIDPMGFFVKQLPHVNHKMIPKYLSKADVFIFASSCENMPITLLEAMASGLPIACSNRGPMPEILRDAGTYFDPESDESILNAVMQIIRSVGLRKEIMLKAKDYSSYYTWQRSSRETWQFLSWCCGKNK